MKENGWSPVDSPMPRPPGSLQQSKWVKKDKNLSAIKLYGWTRKGYCTCPDSVVKNKHWPRKGSTSKEDATA